MPLHLAETQPMWLKFFDLKNRSVRPLDIGPKLHMLESVTPLGFSPEMPMLVSIPQVPMIRQPLNWFTPSLFLLLLIKQ